MVKNLELKSYFEVIYAIFHFQAQLGQNKHCAGSLRVEGRKKVVLEAGDRN